MLFDFDSLEKRLPQWDWAKFIDNEALDGYDRKEILERFLDYNSKNKDEKEFNRKLYYYCSFVKNCTYSAGFFYNISRFYDSHNTIPSINKKQIAIDSLVRHRFQRALDSLDYIIENYDRNFEKFGFRDFIKKCSLYKS